MKLVASSFLAAALVAGFVAPSHGSRMMPLFPYQAKEFAVIKHLGLFHVFYMRADVTRPASEWYKDLGHAISPDLVTWIEQAAILPVRPLEWDNQAIWAPHVVQQGATFYLFYTGVTHQPGTYEWHQRIGVATSVDLMNWERLDAPVYECADASWTFCNPASPVGGDFRDPFLIPDPAMPGAYLMYHVARSGTDPNQFLVGVARSTGDLTQWAPLAPLSSTHRFKTGSSITESPHVLQHDGKWLLFYTTWNRHPIAFQTSLDPLADSASWWPHIPLHAEVPAAGTDDWFGSESFSADGKDYFAAVNSFDYAIELREIVWIGGNHFSFAGESPVAVGERPARWHLGVSASQPGWDRLPIRVEAPHAARVRLEILDAAGRVRRTLLAGSVPPGPTMVTWDGTDEGGRAAASGIYFVSLRTPDQRLTRRVARVR